MAHDHAHETAGKSDWNLVIAVVVNVVLTGAQVAGGIMSGSLALIADALHNFNDAGSLALALIARRISRKPADARRTFGYARAELIGALINLTTLIIVGLYLLYEAVSRYFSPEPIGGWIVVIVAGIALVIDIITAWLTYAMSRESLNIRAAFIHNVSDALASIGVIVAGTLIILYDLLIADLIATVAIAAYVLYQGFSMMGSTIRILMDSVPKGLAFDELVNSMQAVPGVETVHHVHVRELDEHRNALEAHVVIRASDAHKMEEIKGDLRELLSRYDIGHSTLEIELLEYAASQHDTSVLPQS